MAENNRTGPRVCMFAHSYYFHDVRIRRQAEALAAAGFELEVFCTSPFVRSYKHSLEKDPSYPIKVHVLPLRKKRGGLFRYLIEFFGVALMGIIVIAIWHLVRRYDVVHVHNMPDMLVLAGLMPKLLGAKLILDVHDPMVEHFQATYNHSQRHWASTALALQERASYVFPDRIITVSSTMKELLEAKHVTGNRCLVVHNFPDPALFPISAAKSIRSSQNGDFVMLYCGTITQHYRLDIAVRAMKKALKSIPRLKMRMVGGSKKEFERIRRLAESLGLDSRMEFLDGVPPETVKELMADASLGFSSHQGGTFGDFYFSTKIVEFMTQRLPVVCSKTLTISRYVSDDAIFYFEPGDVAGMARQIELVYSDQALVEQKTERALEIAARLNWEQEKLKFVDFYQTFTKHSSAAACTSAPGRDQPKTDLTQSHKAAEVRFPDYTS